jgi:hypothetical protein
VPVRLNDERLNGTMDADFTTTVEPATSPAMHWTGTLRIANADGTWRGQGRGAVVAWPDVDGTPLMNYGVDTYVGEGGYAGLTYHEFAVGGDASADITGWIEPSGG